MHVLVIVTHFNWMSAFVACSSVRILSLSMCIDKHMMILYQYTCTRMTWWQMQANTDTHTQKEGTTVSVAGPSTQAKVVVEKEEGTGGFK